MDDEVQLFAKSKNLPKKTIVQEPREFIMPEEQEPSKFQTFEELGLDPWLIEILRSVFLSQPTSVQKSCIPKILEQSSVVAASPTGTGKTIAFAAPILHLLAREPRSKYALILTPTRELALQIYEQFQLLGKPIRLRASLCIGGFDMIEQAKSLTDKPHIVVATPGRLLDLVRSNPDVTISDFKFLVFDEADRLLDPASTFVKLEIPDLLSKISSTLKMTCYP